MLHYRRTLRDVNQGLRALSAVGGDSDVIMAEGNNLVAPGCRRMHSDAFGAVADLNRWTMIAHPYLFTCEASGH
jgi:hypothetical protein